MKATDTLWHIGWGDGDNCYIVAPDEKMAKKRMGECKSMVNYIVRLDCLYQKILRAGVNEGKNVQ